MDKNNMSKSQIQQRLAVLNRIKQLFLLPVIDCMTLKQVADYFEVSTAYIKKMYLELQDEFDDTEVCVKYPSDFGAFRNVFSLSKNIRTVQGNIHFALDDNTEIIVPNRGVLCFSRRAIVHLGMILDRSPVATELRNQLLNIAITRINNFPNKDEEALIDEEREFMYGLASDTVKGIISFEEAQLKILEFKSSRLTYLI